MVVVSSLSQGRTAAAQCGLFTYKSVPVIFEPPCISFAVYVVDLFAFQEKQCLFLSLNIKRLVFVTVFFMKWEKTFKVSYK